MSNLTYIEKQKLEQELRMGGGYVLDFNNRTFDEFFRGVIGVQINAPLYNRGSGSKANRLRAFWDVATKEQLSLFLTGLRETWSIHSSTPITKSAEKLLQEVLDRLGGKAVKIEQQQNVKDSPKIDGEKSRSLQSQLIALSSLAPQQRGFEFERYLKNLFDAYGLSARASFRLTGEQIDGSFVIHNETYLLEAKWQNSPTAADDLHIFQGKIDQKAAWSRGLFVSFSGFSEDGLIAFGRGKSLICMDGLDLHEMLKTKISLVDVVVAKARRAAETGSPFVRLRDLTI
jgi:hypothetical protein